MTFKIIPFRNYLLPLGVACSQGILFFELPFQAGGEAGILNTGLYFSVISLGALVTLSMMFLHRISPYNRVNLGILGIALSFFIMAAFDSFPLMITLFLLGMSKGILFPAMASLFIELSGGKMFGYRILLPVHCNVAWILYRTHFRWGDPWYIFTLFSGFYYPNGYLNSHTSD